jgi:predicted amidohydrolase
MYVVASKEENLQHAEQMVSEAAQNGAKLIVLPVNTSNRYQLWFARYGIEPTIYHKGHANHYNTNVFNSIFYN